MPIWSYPLSFPPPPLPPLSHLPSVLTTLASRPLFPWSKHIAVSRVLPLQSPLPAVLPCTCPRDSLLHLLRISAQKLPTRVAFPDLSPYIKWYPPHNSLAVYPLSFPEHISYPGPHTCFGLLCSPPLPSTVSRRSTGTWSRLTAHWGLERSLACSRQSLLMDRQTVLTEWIN